MIIAGETEDLVQGLDFARILCVHATNATSNGGDASRVGILRQKFTDKRVISAACEPLLCV